LKKRNPVQIRKISSCKGCSGFVAGGGCSVGYELTFSTVTHNESIYKTNYRPASGLCEKPKSLVALEVAIKRFNGELKRGRKPKQ
jgi:hypothetical protein